MKTKRNEFIEAKLIVDGKVTANDIAETFAMKPASALGDIFGYLKNNPKKVDKNRGDDFLIRTGESIKKFKMSEKRAKELLAAFAFIRKNQDNTDRLTARYAYIEAVLIKFNKIGRDEILRAFELAGAAATRTMQAYVEAAPDNIEMYGRRYHTKGAEFTPKYLKATTKNAEKVADDLINAFKTVVGDDILDPTASKMWRKERGKEEKPARAYRR